MAIFELKYNTNEKGLSTLFKYQYFTVDAKERKNWDYSDSNLTQYMGDYKLCIDESLINKYKDNEAVIEILNELTNVDLYFNISRNMAERYFGEKQYIRCRVEYAFLCCLKKLFISTLVYSSIGQKTPEAESMKFCFDSDAKTVTMSELNLYEPVDNPYFIYARNAVNTLSVEAIGLKQYVSGEEKEIKDFYDRSRMSKWKERKHLEKDSVISDKAGIYMLYDQNRNHFYVGKAIKLQERMLHHAQNASDPIQNFTHYRYSVISGEYYEFLYLIENAAIHDTAWILDMPKAKLYKPSMGTICKNLNECEMVNTHEHQTKKQS